MDGARDRVEFGYWSDPLCVWALAAQPKLDRVLDELGQHLVVDYHVVPVFGSVEQRFAHGAWAKEGVDGRVAATRRIAEQAGRADVSGECWRRDRPASSWAPAAAIKAVFALERDGRAPRAAGAAYQRAIREAFFVREFNVARRAVQLELAEQLAVPREPLEAMLDDGSALAAVWEDHEARERLRIQGSPTYVFDGGRAMLYGNFDFGVLRSTVLELVRSLTPGCSSC